jgi:hypothetical protein
MLARKHEIAESLDRVKRCRKTRWAAVASTNLRPLVADLPCTRYVLGCLGHWELPVFGQGGPARCPELGGADLISGDNRSMATTLKCDRTREKSGLPELAPPFPFGRAPMCCLHFDPIATIAGAIGRCPALRYYALELQAFGRCEELHPGIEAFDQAQAVRAVGGVRSTARDEDLYRRGAGGRRHRPRARASAIAMPRQGR